MNTSSRCRPTDERGISLVEVLIGLVVLTVGLMGILASAAVAIRQTYRSNRDIHLWAAVQWKVDSLVSVGADNVTGGADTVQGYPMSWTVSGTKPKQLELVVERKNFTLSQSARDTVILYLAE